MLSGETAGEQAGKDARLLEAGQRLRGERHLRNRDLGLNRSDRAGGEGIKGGRCSAAAGSEGREVRGGCTAAKGSVGGRKA